MKKEGHSKPILPGLQVASQKELSDFYIMMARNIEDALIFSGAEPGKDYTILDLFKLAQPFVLHRFHSGEIEFRTRWD